MSFLLPQTGLRWNQVLRGKVFDNVESLGGDLAKVILGGLSAGGNIVSLLSYTSTGNDY